MVKNNIKVFARLKPDYAQDVKYEISRRNVDSEELILDSNSQFGDGRLTHGHRFKFHKILNEFVAQDVVFDCVVRPVVNSVINGYNGTIFSYGQTGSGKTFTMTGSPDDYNARGIIPRAVQHVFQAIKDSPEVLYTVYISYLEIYNECGYDLLDQKHDAAKLEDLQRVTTLEDSHGKNHLRNLSVLPVNAEADALRLLFLGDTNRTIAETPMNPFSSRSHCIFTIHIGTRKPNCKAVRRGKLHLVDLAGSERIAKTHLSGSKSLSEAKHINLSLHFLEQVIIALSESGRPHVPYRNSMLTSVLRDSLGGNCLTTMVATLSLCADNIEETISTCRFAQRVAMINNEVMINEEVDPQQEVLGLRAEIVQLKSQLMMFSRRDVTGVLDQEQITKCRQAVSNYLQGITPELEIDIDMRHIRLCFRLLRASALSSSTSPRHSIASDSSSIGSTIKTFQKPVASKEENTLETYKQLIKQRDSEISILINLLRKEKQKNAAYAANMAVPPPSENLSSLSDDSLDRNTEFSLSDTSLMKISQIAHLSDAEKEAFQIFLREANESMEVRSCQRALATKMEEAKRVADKVEQAKQKILTFRGDVMHKCIPNQQCSVDELVNIKLHLQTYQQAYKENMRRLQKLKTETDHIKHGLESANVRLVRRFQDWWLQAQANTTATTTSTITSTTTSTATESFPQDDTSMVKQGKGGGGRLHRAPSNEIEPIKELQKLSHSLRQRRTAANYFSSPEYLEEELAGELLPECECNAVMVRCRAHPEEVQTCCDCKPTAENPYNNRHSPSRSYVKAPPSSPTGKVTHSQSFPKVNVTQEHIFSFAQSQSAEESSDESKHAEVEKYSNISGRAYRKRFQEIEPISNSICVATETSQVCDQELDTFHVTTDSAPNFKKPSSFIELSSPSKSDTSLKLLYSSLETQQNLDFNLKECTQSSGRLKRKENRAHLPVSQSEFRPTLRGRRTKTLKSAKTNTPRPKSVPKATAKTDPQLFDSDSSQDNPEAQPPKVCTKKPTIDSRVVEKPRTEVQPKEQQQLIMSAKSCRQGSSRRKEDAESTHPDYLHQFLNQSATENTFCIPVMCRQPTGEMAAPKAPFRVNYGHYESMVNWSDLPPISEHSSRNSSDMSVMATAHPTSEVSEPYVASNMSAPVNVRQDSESDLEGTQPPSSNNSDTSLAIASADVTINNLTVEFVEADPTDPAEVVSENVLPLDGGSWEDFLRFVPLTGDQEVDAEIIAFYKARYDGMNN